MIDKSIRISKSEYGEQRNVRLSMDFGLEGRSQTIPLSGNCQIMFQQRLPQI